MATRQQIKDVQHESALFTRRALAGFLLIVALLGLLGMRFFYLQISRHEEFASRSDSNRISIRRIVPSRGLIFDRNGVLLADNTAAFRLEVVPEQAGNVDKMLAALADVVPLSDDDVQHFNALRRTKRPFDSVPLRLKLSEDEIARFSVERWRFPGVDVVPYLTRSYPHGELFAHTIGYVGRIDANEASKLDADLYSGSTHIGKTGVERSYEEQLHGKPGYEQVEVNADKRVLHSIKREAPTAGSNLYLTLDARLQKIAEDAFAGRAGAAVALDPRNGEVLAMVSVPSFDPNLFVNGIGQIDYGVLLNAEDRPLLNRALAGGYLPGSTIKPYVALAGLELGVRTPEDTIVSTGEFHIPGDNKRAYRDDVRWGHGRVDLREAIAQSVNSYFYGLALEMGIDRFSSSLGKFGFGAPTGIDLIGEAAGVLPSREWKRGRFNQAWYPGETVIAGIGQGAWVVTPVQLGQAVGVIAAHGVRHRPHLLRAAQEGINGVAMPAAATPAAPNIIHNAANWMAVEEGMIRVVNSGSGTAHGLGEGFPYTIAGKTGTAEKFSRTDEEWTSIGSSPIQRHQVLFECFAPADNARIAVVVALEAGRSGAHDAAPIARAILDAWLRFDDEAPAPTQTAAR